MRLRMNLRTVRTAPPPGAQQPTSCRSRASCPNGCHQHVERCCGPGGPALHQFTWVATKAMSPMRVRNQVEIPYNPQGGTRPCPVYPRGGAS